MIKLDRCTDFIENWAAERESVTQQNCVLYEYTPSFRAIFPVKSAVFFDIHHLITPD